MCHATWLRELNKQHATTLSLAAKIISVLHHARKLISVIYRLLKWRRADTEFLSSTVCLNDAPFVPHFCSGVLVRLTPPEQKKWGFMRVFSHCSNVLVFLGEGGGQARFFILADRSCARASAQSGVYPFFTRTEQTTIYSLLKIKIIDKSITYPTNYCSGNNSISEQTPFFNYIWSKNHPFCSKTPQNLRTTQNKIDV